MDSGKFLQNYQVSRTARRPSSEPQPQASAGNGPAQLLFWKLTTL